MVIREPLLPNHAEQHAASAVGGGTFRQVIRMRPALYTGVAALLMGFFLGCVAWHIKEVSENRDHLALPEEVERLLHQQVSKLREELEEKYATLLFQVGKVAEPLYKLEAKYTLLQGEVAEAKADSRTSQEELRLMGDKVEANSMLLNGSTAQLFEEVRQLQQGSHEELAKVEAKHQALLERKIVLWAGEVAEIPEGWHLCDGQAGTPDLRGRFVRGCKPHGHTSCDVHQQGDRHNTTRASGLEGITEPHRLTIEEMPSHSHFSTQVSQGQATTYAAIHTGQYQTPAWTDDSFTGHKGGDGSHSHRLSLERTQHSHDFDPTPDFYSLAYIMYLGTQATGSTS